MELRRTSAAGNWASDSDGASASPSPVEFEEQPLLHFERGEVVEVFVIPPMAQQQASVEDSWSSTAEEWSRPGDRVDSESNLLALFTMVNGKSKTTVELTMESPLPLYSEQCPVGDMQEFLTCWFNGSLPLRSVGAQRPEDGASPISIALQLGCTPVEVELSGCWGQQQRLEHIKATFGLEPRAQVVARLVDLAA